MCQMLSAPEHDVGGNRRLVGHHPNHVAVDTEILAVDGGLSAQAYGAIIEDCDLGPQRHGAVVPLTVSCARRSTVSLSMASAPVTTTLTSGNFSASRKSAERKWSSRLLILVSTDAAWISMRPKIVWVSVIWRHHR
jgi:hypothetical protein